MTTAITPQRYLDFFRPLLQEGHDILYNCFTSGMSSTYSNAVLATEQLRDEFPQRKLIVVDSLGAGGRRLSFLRHPLARPALDCSSVW